MTMESDLYTLLKTQCPRVFPTVAPIGTPKPYVVFQQMGGWVINPLDNSVPGLKNARMLIKVWGTDPQEVFLLSDQIEDAMRGAAGFKAHPDAARYSDYDSDLTLHMSEQEYSVTY